MIWRTSKAKAVLVTRDLSDFWSIKSYRRKTWALKDKVKDQELSLIQQFLNLSRGASILRAKKLGSRTLTFFDTSKKAQVDAAFQAHEWPLDHSSKKSNIHSQISMHRAGIDPYPWDSYKLDSQFPFHQEILYEELSPPDIPSRWDRVSLLETWIEDIALVEKSSDVRL